MRVVAQLDRPEAQSMFAKWREEHAAVLSALPDDALRIDIGRADGGDFVRVRVEEAYADRFASYPSTMPTTPERRPITIDDDENHRLHAIWSRSGKRRLVAVTTTTWSEPRQVELRPEQASAHRTRRPEETS
jgi:hypothetical protein